MAYSHYSLINTDNGQFSHETISKDSFLNTKHRTLIEIEHKLGTLSDILPYLYRSDVRPIQCDNSITALNEFLKTTKRLCSSVEKLPLQLSKQTNKYKLSITLYYLENEILFLCSLIKTLRPICREEVDKRVEIQVEIQEQFGKILEISKKLTEGTC